MRCIRGQHSKGATNWIMTHEGQIWAGDLASKVAMGSRSVLHSRLLILSRQTGTPAFAAPHTHAHTHMNMYTTHVLCAESQCPSRQRAQVVVIDWIKRLKINACLLAPSTPPPLGLAERKSGLRAPSPLNTLTFHLSTHLLPGHRVSPMLRHRSAGDVGNLSGQPNPHFSCLCVCVSMQACVCTRGFLQESLSLCRQPRRSQTSQCQWPRKQCRC